MIISPAKKLPILGHDSLKQGEFEKNEERDRSHRL